MTEIHVGEMIASMPDKVKLSFNKILRKHWFYLIVQLSSALVLIWWVPYCHLPMPGWSVAAIAVVAAFMSVQEEMAGWEKAVWFVVIGALLVTELRAIRKDRIDSAAQFAADRQAQDRAFKDVRDQQDRDFSATATSLTNAIGGIQLTLKAANKTLLQTQPHAAFHINNVNFAAGPPKTLEPDTQYLFNFYYANTGTAPATDLHLLAKAYIAAADDKEAQSALVRKFESGLDFRKLQNWGVNVPNVPMFVSDYETFTTDQVSDHKATIYFLFRIEYSDETGRWRSDSCMSYQRDSATAINDKIGHNCELFVRFRYPVPRQRK